MEELREITSQIVTALGMTIDESIKEKRMHLTKDRYKPKYASLGSVAHEVGTLPICGPKPQDCVVDENLKFVETLNLYGCDLSVFPVSPAANPSRTLVALAIRLGDHLTDLLPQNKSNARATKDEPEERGKEDCTADETNNYGYDTKSYNINNH
jgi:choline dehydrogenase-like flavoprotein